MKTFSLLSSPIELFGFAVAHDDVFRRLPDDLYDKVNDGVTGLSWDTAGARMRFRTDKKHIHIKFTLRHGPEMGHMAFSGSSGVDCRMNIGGYNYYAGCVYPSAAGQTECEGDFWCDDKRESSDGMIDVTMTLPLYNGIKALELGFDDDARVEAPKKQAIERPIVFYGSSITQGGCASRPSNAYTSLIGDRLDAKYINLGFSGSARGEENICRYIASLEKSCFVMDYDHNAPSLEHYEATHEKFFKIIRESDPRLPIVIVTMPDCDRNPSDSAARLAIAHRTYDNAVKAGDRNVYFVPGKDVFEGLDRDHCTVDRCHPTYIGFCHMANVIGDAVRQGITGDR
ncbi:MAG: hypothetical protein IJT56_08090 [Clostridia bacterium]|nr:hypothetical protein [Clostridia bacterium]